MLWTWNEMLGENPLPLGILLALEKDSEIPWKCAKSISKGCWQPGQAPGCAGMGWERWEVKSGQGGMGTPDPCGSRMGLGAAGAEPGLRDLQREGSFPLFGFGIS